MEKIFKRVWEVWNARHFCGKIGRTYGNNLKTSSFNLYVKIWILLIFQWKQIKINYLSDIESVANFQKIFKSSTFLLGNTAVANQYKGREYLCRFKLILFCTYIWGFYSWCLVICIFWIVGVVNYEMKQ